MSEQALFSSPKLAELRTPEGTFLIQERRAVPREPGAQKPPPVAAAAAPILSSSPAMAALGGVIILGVLIGSYSVKYELAIGHKGGIGAFPAIGSVVLQVFLARVGFRLFDEIRHMSGIGPFIEQRMLRYLPATIPAVILAFVISQFAGLALFQARVSSLLANLTISQDFLGISGIDPSHWRLKIELMFSFLIGAMWFSRARAHIPALLLCGLMLNLIYASGEPTRQHTISLLGLVTADGYIGMLAAGMVLYQIIQKQVSWLWWMVAVLSVAVVFLSNTLTNGFWVLGSLAVLTAVAMGRCGFLGKMSWLVQLGHLAFPVYVVHYVAGFTLIHKLESYDVPPLAAAIVASAVVIILGWAVNMLFERPALKHGPALLQALRRMGEMAPSFKFGEALVQVK